MMRRPESSRSPWQVPILAAGLGAFTSLGVFAPAAWLQGPIARATEQRVQFVQAQGSIWRGSGSLVLTAGAGSRERLQLPGRLQWELDPALSGTRPALRLRLLQSCCMGQAVELWMTASGSGLTLKLPGDAAQTLAAWPAAWLSALGTPWNTLQPGGRLTLAASGIELTLGRAGPERLAGTAALQIDGASSSLSTLPSLGSYRLTVQGSAAAGEEFARVQLQTLQGPLRLDGRGTLSARGLRLEGEARAESGREAALDNLLNLVGRRDGARSILSIGRS